jgi:exosortase
MLKLKSGSSRTVFLVLLSVALFASSWSAIRDLVAYATDWDNTNASQVLMIPLITATLIYLRRKTIFQQLKYDIVPGALIMIAGGAILAFGKTAGLNLEKGDRLALAIFPILVIWWGGFLLFYGARAFKAALFPLLFLILCLPIPSPIMDPTIFVLQHASADVSYVLLKSTGMPIYKEDVVLHVPNLDVVVARECSGIRSGISLLILSLLAGNVALHSWTRKIALLLAAIPILIFKNSLRIGTLSFLAVHVDHRILESRLHQEGGIPFFVVGLLLMYPVLRLLTQSESWASNPSSATPEVNL